MKILQPALGRVGGIWEAKKIAAMAEVFNAEMAPHLYAGPVEWAANIHLAASIPNLLMAETIQTGGAFHLALIRNTIKWEDGYILPPEAPGLGIDFDEDLARAHPYHRHRPASGDAGSPLRLPPRQPLRGRRAERKLRAAATGNFWRPRKESNPQPRT